MIKMMQPRDVLNPNGKHRVHFERIVADAESVEIDDWTDFDDSELDFSDYDCDDSLYKGDVKIDEDFDKMWKRMRVQAASLRRINACLTRLRDHEEFLHRHSADAESGMDINCFVNDSHDVVDLNPSTATVSAICQEHFGEEPLNVRSLLKRYMTNFYDTTPIEMKNDTLVIRGEFQILPQNNMVYALGDDPAFINDLFSYFRYAYLGIKGGIRTRIKIPNTVPITNQMVFWRVGLARPSTDFENIMFVDNQYSMSKIEGTTVFMPATNAGIEAEFPYYSNNLFQICFNDQYQGNVIDDDMESTFFRNFEISMDVHSSVVSTIHAITIDKATGEDFSLLRFQGAPFYGSYPD